MITQELLAKTMVELADSLVDDFDVVDLLTLLSDRCVEILDVQAAGVMLVSPGGELQVLASSSTAMRNLELFEQQSEEGPCQDCYRSGEAVNATLTEADDRWPRFAPRALEAGFRSAHAIPMHVRDLTIGALNLFRADEGEMSPTEIAVAQGLADIATIAIVHNRVTDRAQQITDQLALALNTRISIEQAKGAVAEKTGLDMAETFAVLRNYASRHHVRLVDVARGVVNGTIAPQTLSREAVEPGD